MGDGRVTASTLAGRATVTLAGADAVRFLNNLCTQDIPRLADGQGTEAFLPDAKGRVLDYVFIQRLGDRLVIDAGAGHGPGLAKHLDRYLIREKVAIADRSAELSVHVVRGDGAEDWVRDRFGAAPAAPRGIVAAGFEGHEAILRRCPRGVNPTFDVLLPAAVPFAALGLDAADSDEELADRILAGVPDFDLDIGEGRLPQEVNRTAEAISFTKGCYIGQETVARLDALGHVNRLLQRLTVYADAVPRTGDPVTLDGKPIGTLGSVVGQRWQVGFRCHGLAVLRVEAAVGTPVTVGGATGVVG